MNGPTPRYWVAPGLLLAGVYPGSWDEGEARAKISQLLAEGVRLFVDLTVEREVTWRNEPLLPYVHLVGEEAKALGVSV